MNKKKSHNLNRVFFIISMILFVLGFGLLAFTTGQYPKFRAFFLLAFGALGLSIAYWAINKRYALGFYFFGLTIFFSVLIVFIAKLQHWTLKLYWPLFAIAAGICFLLTEYQYCKKHNKRAIIKAVVPSVTLILFGIFCSVFSFGFARMSFSEFVTHAWPAFFILAAVILFVVYSLRRRLLQQEDADNTDQKRK